MIGTILLVGITVVLAATLYVMVFGLGGGSTNSPPVGSVTKSSVTDGFKFTFTPMSTDTLWSSIYIIISDGTGAATFKNFSTPALSTSHPTTVSLGSRACGTLTLFMNVTDLAGNGYVNQGDSVTVTTSGGQFSNQVTYELYLMHGPTGSQIASLPFQGD